MREKPLDSDIIDEPMWRGKSLLIEDNLLFIQQLKKCINPSKGELEMLSSIENLLCPYAFNAKIFIVNSATTKDSLKKSRNTFFETLSMIAYCENPNSPFAPLVIQWLDRQISHIIMAEYYDVKSRDGIPEILLIPATYLMNNIRKLPEDDLLDPFGIKDMLEQQIGSAEEVLQKDDHRKDTIFHSSFSFDKLIGELAASDSIKVITKDGSETLTSHNFLKEIRNLHIDYGTLLIINRESLIMAGEFLIIDDMGKLIVAEEKGEQCSRNLLKQMLLQILHESSLYIEFDSNLTKHWTSSGGEKADDWPALASRACSLIKKTYGGKLAPYLSTETIRKKDGTKPAKFSLKSSLPLIFVGSPPEEFIKEALGDNYNFQEHRSLSYLSKT